jgi:hypothetical protein
MKSGNLNFLETSGPLQACNGTALPSALPFFYSFLLEAESTPGLMQPEGLCHWKIPTTRDLPACSAVRQPIAPLRAPNFHKLVSINWGFVLGKTIHTVKVPTCDEKYNEMKQNTNSLHALTNIS